MPTEQYSLFLEPSRRRTVFFKKEVVSFVWPNMLFVEKQIGSAYVFAVKENMIKPDMELYHVPTTWFHAKLKNVVNVYSHTDVYGSICFNSKLSRKISKGEYTVRQAFWGSGFSKYPDGLLKNPEDYMCKKPILSSVYDETKHIWKEVPATVKTFFLNGSNKLVVETPTTAKLVY